MKLSLVTRTLEHTSGLKLYAKPLTAADFQLWFSHLLKHKDAEASTLAKLLFQDLEAAACAQSLLTKYIHKTESFITVTDEGERPGELNDLFYGNDGLMALYDLMGQLQSASVLTEPEAKN